MKKEMKTPEEKNRATSKPMRQLGAYGNTVKISDDFDDPLPDEILDYLTVETPKTSNAHRSRAECKRTRG
jgi:hypothetical protein